MLEKNKLVLLFAVLLFLFLFFPPMCLFFTPHIQKRTTSFAPPSDPTFLHSQDLLGVTSQVSSVEKAWNQLLQQAKVCLLASLTYISFAYLAVGFPWQKQSYCPCLTQS